MNLTEALRLLSRLPKNPLGVFDELKVRWELRHERLTLPSPTYQPEDFDDVITKIEECLQKDLRVFLQEPALAEIEKEIQLGLQKLFDIELPFSVIHNGDIKLGKLCYIICRAAKPSVFVETGVAYGVTSSFILKALKINNRGRLFSIDQPPVTNNAANFVGRLIPEDLRHNWQLLRGKSQTLLPNLVAELKEVDIFLHDSRHTYSNMSAEFQTVAPFLPNYSFLIADDVNRNTAFQEWVAQTNPAFWATITENEKESLFGVSVFLEKPSNYQKRNLARRK